MYSPEQPEIQIIIPAAGSSKRLGSPKQLVEYEGKPLWLRTLSLCQLLNAPVTMVTGAWQPNKELPKFATELYFSDWESGMGSSIAYAVKNIPKPSRGYLILLIDQWGLTSQSLLQFIEKWDKESIQIAKDDSYSGPPVLLPSWLKKELEALEGDRGAKQLTHKHLTRRIGLPQSSWDLDTIEDLYLLQQLAHPSDAEEFSYDYP